MTFDKVEIENSRDKINFQEIKQKTFQKKYLFYLLDYQSNKILNENNLKNSLKKVWWSHLKVLYLCRKVTKYYVFNVLNKFNILIQKHYANK